MSGVAPESVICQLKQCGGIHVRSPGGGYRRFTGMPRRGTSAVTFQVVTGMAAELAGNNGYTDIQV